MRRITALLLAGLAALTLTGCRRGPGLLPYAREIEDMELMQTLGVDAAGEGQVEVTASSGSGDPAEGAAAVVSGQAGTISAAVLGMQGEGSSYLYFGHVGQLLLGEELARQGVEPALDYILRDVETRLDTALYLVRGGTAGKAITAAGEDGSAADRLEALAEDAGLLAGSMPRTVKDALSDLYAQGATFLPAVEADEALTAAGYGILKGDRLAGWAEGDAALGVNLVLGQVDADVVELPLDGGGVAALRVVGARTSVRPVMDGGALPACLSPVRWTPIWRRGIWTSERRRYTPPSRRPWPRWRRRASGPRWNWHRSWTRTIWGCSGGRPWPGPGTRRRWKGPLWARWSWSCT